MNDDSRVPMLRWARAYKRGDLRYDVIAGITVSALVIPKALGYADIAACRSNTVSTPLLRAL